MKIILDPNGYVINASADPATHFHPDYAALFVTAPGEPPADLAAGWRWADDEWIAPPAPSEPEPHPRALTYVEFIMPATQAGGVTSAAYAQALANPELILFFDLLKTAQGIRIDDPMMATGAAAFIAAGLLTEASWQAMQDNWPRD